MKFLLVAINAKYIHSNPAVYSMKAYVGEEAGKSVEIAEYTINQYGRDILADIYRKKPDVIGFSCYIWNWDMVQELLAELPKVLPGTKLWLGGPEVSFDAPEILKKYPQLSGIMVGEGEVTFRELLDYYRETDVQKEMPENARKTLAEIAGLCLPQGYTAPRELTDLSEIPFLYSEDNKANFENRIIYYESSRGCPYRCSYCLSSVDKKVRFRELELVKKELQFFLDAKVPQVKFVDRTFNCSHEHTMAVWQYIYENDNGVTNFHFEVSADILREEELELLSKMRPGLVQLEIGVQSTNPETIQAIQRVMDVEKLRRIVERIRAGRNIHQHLDLIAGLPFEDYNSFGKSFNQVYEMKPDQLQLGFLKVLKGSPMHERAEEYEIRYLDKPPYEVLSTKWLSYEEILRLKGVEEMVELYYNSAQFTHTLPVLQKAFETPFAMFEALADFYQAEGHAAGGSSRMHRYDILLAFAEKYDGSRLKLYKELLTFDMYLREKLKTRPAFAADLTDPCIKEQIRIFYQKEETERKYLSDYAEYDSKQMSKMTHLEPFYYTVWESEVNLQESNIPIYILFDYKRRSPLNKEAFVQVISD